MHVFDTVSLFGGYFRNIFLPRGFKKSLITQVSKTNNRTEQFNAAGRGKTGETTKVGRQVELNSHNNIMLFIHSALPQPRK